MKRLHAAARFAAGVLGLALGVSSVAHSETVADFYRGKTIELAIAGAAAGAMTLLPALSPTT